MLEQSTLTHKRYAICVGINTYAPSSELHSLRFAEHDAQAMDETLGTLGFEQDDRVLLLGKQATLAAINEALNEMTDRAEENDLVVFYFAGHGVPLYFEKDDTRDVFLASYDFDPQQLEQRRSLRTRDALGMERLRREYFEGQGSRKRLFLFDSCYSGEFAGFRSGGEQAVQQHMQKMLDSKSTGRVALLSCLPEQVAVETVKHGHGRFTYYLLQALQGKAPQALRRDGWLTVNTLFEYLSQQLPEAQRPVLSGIQHDVFEIVCYPDLVRPALEQTSALQRASAISEKEAYVRAMLADHTDFLRDRLESFVGREQEVAELRQRIADKIATGGYVIITGQAGQGKSSIMAKLVDSYGREQVPFHFIPFSPGPDHQVGLLRNLMARLVLKYQLSEIYVSAENRATLRDYFPNVLREVAAKGGQEIIFIDGLDQIEEDVNGVRDLSFLPTNPPAGIVFVLATRPDDALRPLVLLKPHEQYPLPNLRRDDFDLILQHRGVALDRHLTDRFYQAMSKNALYLDLVAKELHGNPGLSPQEMIAHIAHNPDNIFTLAITRFKRQPLEWREVIKPILGVLLAAREPLAFWHLRQILGLDDDRLRDGITRLGGLLRESGQRQYSLFHLKWQEYLRQDEQRPEKDYVFAADEEEQWHERLATWCEPIAGIWQESPNRREQGRREYARYHYIQHLYGAHHDEKLFVVLDEGSYGKAKEQYDRSNRSYIQDLDLGRRAAIRYGTEAGTEVEALPLLWKYTLLRSSLRSQADNYPESFFQALLLLHREKDVLGLVELITEDKQRVAILNKVWLHFAQNNQPRESWQILTRALSIAQGIEDVSTRNHTFGDIVKALALAQWWERAEEMVQKIEDDAAQEWALGSIVKVLAQAQQWEQGEEIAQKIEDNEVQGRALRSIVGALMQAQQWERAEETARRIKDVSYHAWALYDIVQALMQAQQWEQAEEIAGEIKDAYYHVRALCDIAQALAQVQQWEQMEAVLRKAEVVAQEIEDIWLRAEFLCDIAQILAQVHQWEKAEVVLRKAEAVAREYVSVDEIALEEKNALGRVTALGALMRGWMQVQQWEMAEVLLREAEERARLLESFPFRMEAWRRIALFLTSAQQWERAEAFAQAIEHVSARPQIVSRIASDRAEILSGIAHELARMQQWERAERVLINAEKLTRGIQVPYHNTQTPYQSGGGPVPPSTRARCEIVQLLVQAQQWERAEHIAQGIDYALQKAQALSEIARALALGRQWKRAEAVLELVVETAQGIEDVSLRADTLSQIVEIFVWMQQWEKAESVLQKAEAIAREPEYTYRVWEALCSVIGALTQAQQWELAITAVGQIRIPYYQARSLCEIAQAQARAQQWEQAVEVLGKAEEVTHGIASAPERDDILSVMVQAFALTQQWKKGEEVVEEIEDAEQRVRVLCAVAQVLTQSQQWERADVFLRKAEVMMRESSMMDTRDNIADRIVRILILMQQWERAEAIVQEIERVNNQITTLSEIAQALARNQQWERAQTLFERAEEIAQEIKHPSMRVDTWCKIAQALAQVHQWEKADVMLQRAEETAREIRGDGDRVESLHDVVQAMVSMKQLEKTRAILGNAEEIAWETKDSSSERDDLPELVQALALSQQWEKAEAMASGIQDIYGRVDALRSIAQALVHAQQWQVLLGLIQRSWLCAETREYAILLLPLAYDFIKTHPQLGMRFLEAIEQVDTFISQ